MDPRSDLDGSGPEFTDQGLVRRAPRGPAPVAESWRRIEKWLSGHCPEVLASLLPGASDEEIAAFEEAIGRELPEDVRESCRIRDGLGPIPREYTERVRGDDDDDEPAFVRSLFYECGLGSIGGAHGGESILDRWQYWAGAGSIDDGYGESEVFPADAIQLRDYCRDWIPLIDLQEGSFLGIDLAPGPAGVVGQVINFGGLEEHKFVLATSWGQFLEDYADELEAGNFEIEEEPGDGIRQLRMKRPGASSPFCWHWREWAEAKLDPAFQAVEAPESLETAAADPETERECRAAVDGFIAEYCAWERQWLAVRPVGELGFRSVSERPDGTLSCSPRRKEEFTRASLPVPAAVAYIEESGKSHLELGRDDWLRAQLGGGSPCAPAMAERVAIFARYATAWARQSLDDDFTLDDSPRFDPEEYRDAMVFRAGENAAYVWSIRGDARRRFLLIHVPVDCVRFFGRL